MFCKHSFEIRRKNKSDFLIVVPLKFHFLLFYCLLACSRRSDSAPLSERLEQATVLLFLAFPTPVLHLSPLELKLLFILFCQEKLSAADRKESPFIRALVTVVCEGAMDKGSHKTSHGLWLLLTLSHGIHQFTGVMDSLLPRFFSPGH